MKILKYQTKLKTTLFKISLYQEKLLISNFYLSSIHNPRPRLFTFQIYSAIRRMRNYERKPPVSILKVIRYKRKIINKNCSVNDFIL